MNTISFMSANYVARLRDYHIDEWGEGDRATNDYFAPPATFAERFEGLLRDIRALGFDALDLWTAHLNYRWATEAHIATAKDLLGRHNLRVTSLAGGFGESREQFEAACRLAAALGASILGGMTPLVTEERGFVIETLRRYGLRLAIENHPEKSPREVLDKIGDGGDGVLGTALDTGWYGTQGYDAAQAVLDLRDHLVHVHLKNVVEAGAHVNTGYTTGCVPLEGVVNALKDVGYRGPISVENHTTDHDPTAEIREARTLLEGWLA